MQTTAKDGVVLIKIGGSSITDKGKFETVNKDALTWLVQTIKQAIEEERKNKKRFIVVHGAGSFGHYTAKEYGLKGITSYPPFPRTATSDVTSTNNISDTSCESVYDHRQKLLGLGRTRLSVQKLNQLVVTAFLDHHVPAVGISPCFGIVQETSAVNIDNLTTPEQQLHNIQSIVQSTIDAGLIPVLHGDAGLFREYSSTGSMVAPAIISGDTIMQMIGTAKYVTDVIFITDVDGVYTSDPNNNDPNATLIPKLFVDRLTSSLMKNSDKNIRATESLHDHDVTGGLKTKLAAAIAITASGKEVTIVRSETIHAERAILQRTTDDDAARRATVLVPV